MQDFRQQVAAAKLEVNLICKARADIEILG
jgi:hypothetical protein